MAAALFDATRTAPREDALAVDVPGDVCGGGEVSADDEPVDVVRSFLLRRECGVHTQGTSPMGVGWIPCG